MAEYLNTYTGPKEYYHRKHIALLADIARDWPQELKVYQKSFDRRKGDWRLMKRKSSIETGGDEMSIPSKEGQYFIWIEPGGPIAWWNLNVSIEISVNVKLLTKMPYA